MITFRHAAMVAFAASLNFVGASPLGAQVTATRDDGRVTAVLTADDSSVMRTSSEFVRAIKLRIQWWGLIGQPVYHYGFQWLPSGRIELPDGRELRREDLDDHADLLKRFDALRPYSVQVSFDTEVTGRDNAPSPNLFAKINYLPGKAKGTVTTGTLAVGRPSVMHLDLSPGSPRNWVEFVDWWSGEPSSGEFVRNTFQGASQFDFSKLRIARIEVPHAQASAILDALEARKKQPEKNSAKAPARDSDFWSGEEKEAFATGDASVDEYWSGGEKEKSDFWAGDGGASDEIALEKAIAARTGHQFLGAKTVDGTYVTLRYRDHGQVDGDRVRVFRNGQIIEGNATLRSGYTSKRIPLAKGTNRISFEALNTGSAGENTASFSVLNTDGSTLYAHEWSISTGFKATLILLRN